MTKRDYLTWALLPVLGIVSPIRRWLEAMGWHDPRLHSAASVVQFMALAGYVVLIATGMRLRKTKASRPPK